MADELGDDTFKAGGALHKISTLANTWEQRARKAERIARARLLERAGWFVAGAGVALVVVRFVVG